MSGSLLSAFPQVDSKYYCGRKATCIAWIGVKFGKTLNFLTGTDEENNRITLWNFNLPLLDDDVQPVPTIASELIHNGGVTSITPLGDQKHFYTTSTKGHLNLYRVSSEPLYSGEDPNKTLSTSTIPDEQFLLDPISTIPDLHASPTTCLSISENQETTVTGGEDGTLNVINTSTFKRTQAISNADSSSIVAVDFTSNSTVMSISTSQVKLWDLREGKSAVLKSRKAVTPAGNPVILQCGKEKFMYVATGSSKGSVLVWDMRRGSKLPVTIFNQHVANVWKIDFHPAYPENMLSCAEDGQLLLWENLISGNLPDKSHIQKTQRIFRDPLSINAFDIHPDVNIITATTDSNAILFKTTNI